jgi:hypothetical protein
MSRLISPSTNFASVRDGRNSQVFYVDIALDTARSVATGTQLVLPISGNSFYADANPVDGNCVVHFQDTNFDRGPVPLYVSPGAIFNIPYTQVLFENSAQPGKKIRIAYGIDVDFQPGSVSQIAVTSAGGYTAVRPEAPTGAFASNTGYAAGSVAVLAPGSNLNGVIVYSSCIYGYNSAATQGISLIAKATAPLNTSDGDVLLSYSCGTGLSGGAPSVLPAPQYVAAGLGLWFYGASADSAHSGLMRSARWKAL